jgi:phosphoribosylformylglycinamidine synthase PurS subunit
LDAESQDAANAQVDEMCQKLLANIVIEQYRFDLEESPSK